MRAFVSVFTLFVVAFAKPQYNYDSGPIAAPQVPFTPVATNSQYNQHVSSGPIASQNVFTGHSSTSQISNGANQHYSTGAVAPQHFGGSSAAAQHFGGSPAASQHFGGSSASSQHFGGSPAAGQHFGGSPAAAQHFGGSPAATQNFGGSPAGAQHFGGSPAATQHFGGSPAAAQNFGGSPAAAQHFGGSPAATQHFGGSPAAAPHFATPQVGGEYHDEPVQQTHQAPLITKQFYLHSAPEDHSSVQQTKHLVLGRPQKNYRVVFIKNPSDSNANVRLSAEFAPQEEKTVVYVLSQKDTALDIENIATPAPTQPSKPEVFFIKYKTPEEAAHAQQEIQSQYDVLGGTSSIVNGGTAPVSSVVGALDGGAGNHGFDGGASNHGFGGGASNHGFGGSGSNHGFGGSGSSHGFDGAAGNHGFGGGASNHAGSTLGNAYLPAHKA